MNNKLEDSMKEKLNAQIGVVVTTTNRGVFFGYVSCDADLTSETLRLMNCRMCIKWPEENHGIVGLASNGPLKGARISPSAPAITIKDITSVMECSDEAVIAWENEPWN